MTSRRMIKSSVIVASSRKIPQLRANATARLRVAGAAARAPIDLSRALRRWHAGTREAAARHCATAIRDKTSSCDRRAAILVTNGGETQLAPGICAGFKAGSGDAHHL